LAHLVGRILALETLLFDFGVEGIQIELPDF